ncbi:biotin carboxyl carrier protein of acetyl-CoA carboxylase, chloroplastic-like isoform X3 [Carya illinoinensis]|nr:biotin carboxyl carrier protein of acetyl-CoA carboxylase, chloroplastic-like isoform X3 [Carya illinoinensis]
MASSLTTASASASAVSKASTTLTRLNNNCTHFQLSFRLPLKPSLPLLTKGFLPGRNYTNVVKARLNKVGVDGSSNADSTPSFQSEVVAPEAKDAKPSNDPSSGALVTEESISEFIAQVSSLVKLVDSRDIVELELKQLDCEILIRKRDALPQPPPSTPVTSTHSHAPLAVSPAQPAPANAPSLPPTAPSSSTSAVKSAKSSLPPLKCPMAGTFYRSPGPSEPPFVQIGDKVQKGQVLCIIEAMKLMNEIEWSVRFIRDIQDWEVGDITDFYSLLYALNFKSGGDDRLLWIHPGNKIFSLKSLYKADQSGTIVEIVAEDGKPVSVDTVNCSRPAQFIACKYPIML